jgi:hypothetical protein
MSGYTRQSVADIVPTAVVRAAPINSEYNKLRDAFAQSDTGTTGHKHDGTSDEGSYVPLIADLDALNKIQVSQVNNRFGVWVEVAGTSTEQFRFQDGLIVPVVDNDIDLGTSSLEFKNVYVDGTAFIDTVSVGDTDNTVITDNAYTVTGDMTFDVSGDINLDADGGDVVLKDAGNTYATLTSNTGNLVLKSGATTAITFTGANADIAGTLDVTGATVLDSTLSVTGLSILPTVNIDGGTIDGTVIGGSSAQAITGTLITASTGFSGNLTGNVTGNLTGNVTGDVTGDLTGDVTGNITASSGSSSFNDVVINGTLNMNAGTTATITNLTTPVNAGDAATKGYVDTSISDVIASAPAALDTLNELAAALGDDANFSTTVTNSIATKLPLAGGTMSGIIAMGTSKITGLGDPTANQDAATKAYVDTADATKLNLSGGTMTGNIVLGANKATSTATPTADDDLTRKAYVDSILGSATSAASSAAAAAISETNAATSETNASSSAASAAASFDSLDDRYLGAKASAPTLDNDGDALLTGALYWNTSTNNLFIWTGSAWNAAAFDVGTALFDADIGSTVQGYDANLDAIDQGLATTDSPTFVTLNATTVDLGDWTITESGGSLYFAAGGNNKMKLDASGNLEITGTIDTVATIS